MPALSACRAQRLRRSRCGSRSIRGRRRRSLRRDRLGVQVDAAGARFSAACGLPLQVVFARASATSAGWRLQAHRALQRRARERRLAGVLLDVGEREQRFGRQRVACDGRCAAAQRAARGSLRDQRERLLGGFFRALRLPLRPGGEQRRDDDRGGDAARARARPRPAAAARRLAPAARSPALGARRARRRCDRRRDVAGRAARGRPASRRTAAPRRRRRARTRSSRRASGRRTRPPGRACSACRCARACRAAAARQPGATRAQLRQPPAVQRRLNGCVARPAAAIHASSSASASSQPDEAEVGERLHDEAVRVPDFERLGAVAQARGPVASARRRRARGGPRRPAAPPSSSARARSPTAVRRPGVFGGGLAFGLVSE